MPGSSTSAGVFQPNHGHLFLCQELLLIHLAALQVSEDYLEHLLALDRKIKFITTDEMARGSQARKDLGPVLEKLRIKAIIKV